MSKRLFTKSVGNIDDELLMRYDRIDKKLSQKRTLKPMILKITAFAACFCVIAGAMLAAIYSGNDTPQIQSTDVSDALSVGSASDTSDEPKPPIQNGGNYVIGEDDSVFIDNYDKIINDPTQSGSSNEPAYFWDMAYTNGMLIVASVEDFMPDTYCYPGNYDSKWGYRVLKLRVKEVIVGENVPDELYYLLHGAREPDLREYEDIIFAFRQAGVGETAIVNRDKKRVEAFENLVFDHTMEGSVIAYNGGKCDISLFDKKGFEGEKNHFLKYYMQGEIQNEYDCPVKQNNSLEETVEALRAYASNNASPYSNHRFVHETDFNAEGSKEIFEYVKPFENGYFAQREFSVDSTRFVRIINGFFTNESFYLTTSPYEQNEDSGVRFTEEDIKNAPDIGRFIANLDYDSLKPPHTENADELELGSRCVMGKYVKHNGKVYAIIRIYWTLLCDDWSYVEDDTYYVVNADGSGTVLERDELCGLIGNDGIICSFPYNERSEVIYE